MGKYANVEGSVSLVAYGPRRPIWLRHRLGCAAATCWCSSPLPRCPAARAIALRWTDIDLDAGLVNRARHPGRIGGKLVVSEPKTDRSRRNVPLGAPLVAMLRARRKQQAAERLHAGDQWTDCGLVFATEFGTPVEPRNLLRTVGVAATRKPGVEGGRGAHACGTGRPWRGSRQAVHIKAVAESARALVDRGHRRHLRPYVRRCCTRGGRRS